MSKQKQYRQQHIFDGAWYGRNQEEEPWELIERDHSTALAQRQNAVARPRTRSASERDAESRAAGQGYEIAHRAAQRPTRATNARPVQPRDDALTHAHAARLSALPKLAVFGAVTLLLLVVLLAVRPFDVGAGWYFVAALLAWGGYSLRALNYDRAVGLRHSAAGIELERETTEREDIYSRERIARHALDRHYAYLDAQRGGE